MASSFFSRAARSFSLVVSRFFAFSSSLTEIYTARVEIYGNQIDIDSFMHK
jgi:hypothetical protein